MMSDGTRVQAQHVVSYRAREESGGQIWFVLVNGRETAMACGSPQKQAAKLAELDQLFGVIK